MMKLLIVGIPSGTNVGESLYKAAQQLNLQTTFIDTRLAYQASALVRRFNWYLRGKRPTKLDSFSQYIVRVCHEIKPQVLLTTGLIAAINRQALREIAYMGIKTINFLTDDPWNKAHYAPWFQKALPEYELIFSPRRANIPDLTKLGCKRVEYLPFGYDPEIFYPDTQSNTPQFDCDLMFAGGADRDRIPYMDALIRSDFQVDLYGQYWERYSKTKNHARGYADPQKLRSAITKTKIALCLVRRANRDGNVMRTFEIPAIGTCMLTEDTSEHRDIFGENGKAVVYFKSIPEMVERSRWLLNHDRERQKLAQKAHLLITQGEHKYEDRLITMLNLVPSIN